MEYSLETIPIFCINLDKRTDRLDNITKRLNNHGLNFTRWEAETPETIKNLITDEFKLTPYYASTISHMKLWKHIVDNNIEVALILEDDASFRNDWKNIMNEKLSKYDEEDWNCLFLKCNLNTVFTEAWERIDWQICAGGYLIRLKTAKYLIDKYYWFETIDNIPTIDTMLLNLQQTFFKSQTYFPWLIIQDNSKSDINLYTNVSYRDSMILLQVYNYDLSNYDLIV